MAIGTNAVNIVVTGNATAADDVIKDVQKRLKEFAATIAEASLGIDDKAANTKIDRYVLRLAALNRMTLRTNVTVEGIARTEVGLAALREQFDKTAKSADKLADNSLGRLSGRLGGMGLGIGKLLTSIGGGIAGGSGVPGIGGFLGGLGSLGGTGSGGTALGGAAGIGGGLAAIAPLLWAIANAAAGASTMLVGGLGAAITKVGVTAALKIPAVAGQFKILSNYASTALSSISEAFRPALYAIAQMAQAQAPGFFLALRDAMGVIAPGLKLFGTTFVKALGDANVQNAIRTIGFAFGQLLKAFTPTIIPVVNAIANGIRGMAEAVAAHPEIFVKFVEGIGIAIGEFFAFLGAMTRVANWMNEHLVPIFRAAFDFIVGLIKTSSDIITGRWAKFGKDFTDMTTQLWNNSKMIWGSLWGTVTTWTKRIVDDVVKWFGSLPGQVMASMRGFGHDLWQFGSFVLSQLWEGMKATFSDVWSWFSSLPGKLLHAIGINSPPKWAIEAGKHIMGGLLHGVTSRKGELLGALQGSIPMQTGALSGNASLAQSFAASILPRGWSFQDLVALWNRESGWNAYAVNPSSGAYGIPQSLGHGHPYNLGDYKAQIVWGLNYIASRYGSSQAAWGHEMAFGWYDQGGWLPPGLSLAMNKTGRPERVLGPGDGQTITLVIEAGNSNAYTKFLVQEIQKYVRTAGGGDVQVAFGRNT